ncbi:hypothetical protein FQR65_LT08095 [Abscondita terminalis]|nr:hypothetical protein FQR65_LT08095 [Abscondita terminalis]
MFIHSEKVPRLYKIASKCLKEIIENGSSLKELVYKQKFPNLKSLYALLAKSLQHFSEINRIIDKSQLLVNEPRFNPWLARILVTQLFWSDKGLEGTCKPVATILSYRAALEKHKLNKDGDRTMSKVTKPRYVRVNTLAISLDEAVNGFCNEGWELVNFKGETYDDFITTVNALKKNQFMIDVHIKELFVFPPRTQFHNHDAYRCKSIILQDKASCLPVHLLNASLGSTVLDMCAAPGMKTTFLAARLNNKGLVYAVENNLKRYQTMNTVIDGTYATCIKTIHNDVLLVTPEQCPDVEYILVDPSCTGSGITDRLTIDNEVEKADQARLTKLSYLQTLLLKHALNNFPRAKRVVYSTCSTYTEENECVVDEVLRSNVHFKLVSAHELLDFPFHKPKYRGDHLDYIRSYCVRTSPGNDLTNGFFIAVFERNDSLLIETTDEKPKRKENLNCESTKKRVSMESNDLIKIKDEVEENLLLIENVEVKEKCKKKSKKNTTSKEEALLKDGEEHKDIIQSAKKTKKSKDASDETDRGIKQEIVESDYKMEKNLDAKKSKKKRKQNSEHNEGLEDATFLKTEKICEYDECTIKKENRKSKKKRKMLTNDDVDESHSLNNETLIHTKKKKRKHSTSVDDSNVDEQLINQIKIPKIEKIKHGKYASEGIESLGDLQPKK